jgi:ABC-type branched-subunit amino acid transport system ATPase component
MKIELANVRAGYGRFSVLHGIDLFVSSGDFRLIVGPNGAGKTTMLNAIFGIVPPASGKITVGDLDASKISSRALLDAGLAYVPQQSSTFPQMTVADNLEMGLFQIGASGLRKQALMKEVFDRFEQLGRRKNVPARTLSGGERRLLELARALMTTRALLLDEPSLGLSPVVMERILKEIVEINNQGVTVVLVEQRVKAVASAAKSISVLRLGRIVRNGSNADACDDRWLASALYGEASDVAMPASSSSTREGEQ